MNRMKYVHLFALLSIFAFSSPGQSACVVKDPCHKTLDTACRDHLGAGFVGDHTKSCPEDDQTGECDGTCKYTGGDRPIGWFPDEARGSLPR